MWGCDWGGFCKGTGTSAWLLIKYLPGKPSSCVSWAAVEAGPCLMHTWDGMLTPVVSAAAVQQSAPDDAPSVLQETHPYFVLQRIRSREGDVRASSFKEAADIATPVFHPPWQPLRCGTALPARTAAVAAGDARLARGLCVNTTGLAATCAYHLYPACHACKRRQQHVVGCASASQCQLQHQQQCQLACTCGPALHVT